MALAVARTVALVGVHGHLVEVEAHLAQGLPVFALVGLPDASLSESRDRVRAAVVNSGQAWPSQRLTVNLSPASLPKSGSAYDLAIAGAVLAAAGVVPVRALSDTVLLGELGLDGRLRPVRGILPAVVSAAEAGIARVVVPERAVPEARLVPGVEVFGVRSLRQLVALARGDAVPDEPAEPAQAPVVDESVPLDLADVIGQPSARYALELAAAGGHHLFLLGPPGVGKTMLAERLPGILPELDPPTALEVTAVHSVAGTLPDGVPLIRRPPFQAPHHTATRAAVIGGGSGAPRPGAASLAHRGVLFLDEAPEFATGVLDALREPLESGTVVVSRAGGAARYPARFRLVLAANPCPCGLASTVGADCRCAPFAQRRYLHRLSGPLLDRIDIRLTLLPVTRAERAADSGATTTAEAAARVADALARARARLTGTPWTCNGEVPGHELRRRWPLPRGTLAEIDSRLHSGSLSMRGADRVLRVAWTMADLAALPRPSAVHVSTALAFRDSAGTVAA